MTDKFVRDKFYNPIRPIDFPATFHKNTLDLFQSFEDRISHLEKYCIENASINFLKHVDLQQMISSLENKIIDREEKINQLEKSFKSYEGQFETENKILREDINYLREKILSKEELYVATYIKAGEKKIQDNLVKQGLDRWEKACKRTDIDVSFTNFNPLYEDTVKSNPNPDFEILFVNEDGFVLKTANLKESKWIDIYQLNDAQNDWFIYEVPVPILRQALEKFKND